MTQLTEHAKTILRAIADGKQVKGVCADKPHTTAQVLLAVANGFSNNLMVCPETRSINGVEFAAPGWDGDFGGFKDLLSRALLYLEWVDEKDRDTAYQAIIDALGGKTE